MDRLDFEKVLASTVVPEGTSSEKMKELLMPLSNTCIQLLPERLFKYRSCCDEHISAYEQNEMWLSTSDLFNDPFDTLLQYNEDELKSAITSLSDPKNFTDLTRHIVAGGQMADPLETIVDTEEKDKVRRVATESIKNGAFSCPSKQLLEEIFSQLDQCVNQLPQIIQRISHVACLTEKVDNILMWSHYSNNHTGFALGYDFRRLLLPNVEKVGIYPVVYSDKRYDAYSFFYYSLCKYLQVPAHNPDIMSHIKLLLYKSTYWQYEKEWRLIGDGNNDCTKGSSRSITLVPNSIYYGCKISSDNFNTLHRIAKNKGLEEYQVSVENNCSEYRMSIKRLS